MWSSDGPRRRVLLALAPLALAACGFELRRIPALPFRSIALTGFAPRSPFAAELRDNLAKTVRVVDAPAQAEVVLQALGERREKSVVASTAAAQVREFQLRLTFRFRVETPAGHELIAPVDLELQNDLSYAENFALAKQQEEDELFRQMQTDAVMQVMRRLASIQR
jgi:LPS-assembly lipoprotein